MQATIRAVMYTIMSVSMRAMMRTTMSASIRAMRFFGVWAASRRLSFLKKHSNVNVSPFPLHSVPLGRYYECSEIRGKETMESFECEVFVSCFFFERTGRGWVLYKIDVRFTVWCRRMYYPVTSPFVRFWLRTDRTWVSMLRGWSTVST
jgi:hypothetical protein